LTGFTAIARRGGAWLPLIGFGALAGTAVTLALPAVLGHAIVAGDAGGRWLAAAAGLLTVGVRAELLDVYAGTTAWLRNRLVRHVLASGPGTGHHPPPQPRCRIPFSRPPLAGRLHVRACYFAVTLGAPNVMSH
jgi:hypothetical protein